MQKRAELKAAGDYVGLQNYPKCFTSKTTQQLSINWQSKGYMRQFGISRICFRNGKSD